MEGYNAVQWNRREPRAVILQIDDDSEVAQTVRDILEPNGYVVHHAMTGADGKAMLDEIHPDLVILDLMLPDADGLILCTDIKAKADVPVIICSGTARQRDSVLGLKLGADDFIAKPFMPAELEARVGAVLRRSGGSRATDGAAPAAPSNPGSPGTGAPPASAASADRPQEYYRIGTLVIEHSRRRASIGDQALQLTPTEYRLLATLASRPDEVVSRDELAQAVWGYQDTSIGRAIDVHIRRLRVKLASGPVPPPEIVSVRGFGYKIVREGTAETVEIAHAS